jgi:dTDP-4-dehydrorhamnose reductase
MKFTLGLKFLITGAHGQLGRALQLELSNESGRANSLQEGGKNHRLWLYSHHQRRSGHNISTALDIADAAAVHTAITNAKPDVVIHTAAWTDTAGCEHNPERAMLVNATGARNVAEACREAGATMVHISTNEVFDGEKGAPYHEDDATHAINEYGRSKEAAENAVRETLPEHYIVRTSWLYGPGRASFPEKVLQNARGNGRLRLVTDEVASPTLTGDLAAAIARLIEARAYSTYHLTNSGECSRYDWAAEVLRLAGVEVPIEGITLDEYGSLVRKPKRSTLANNRAAAFGITLRPWQKALREHMHATAGARA